MCLMISLSRHLAGPEVSAIGLSLFRQVTLDCLGMGTIVAALRQAGTHDVDSDML